MATEELLEVRDDLMVSPTGYEKPTMRLAHFLKPTINSIDDQPQLIFDLPSHCLSSLPPTFEPKNWPLKLTFHGWNFPQPDWKTWVEKMASSHEHTWKKAGIHEAILNSTYKIIKNDDLVLGLAEKWCPETKSFIFAWGEATITLEDVMIFGFSVLGSPVFSPLETEEMKKIKEKLEQARVELTRTADKKAGHFQWMKKFMDSGSDVEHEAFLALWLSRSVFSLARQSIVKSVFPIAIHLAKGTKIALAPAILASIYTDLSSLKEKIVTLTKLGNGECSELTITIRSQFQLVKIWAWERFIELRPNPNLIKNGEPRLAQWHAIMMKPVENVRAILDSAKDSFDWRPYCKTVKNWNMPKFYSENEMCISVDPDLCEELHSFARCLRISELVGVDCIEQYLPHRVAMQFGMDQDLPVCVARANQTTSSAWSYYSKPFSYGSLYIPSRHFKADVTNGYLSWWKQSISRMKGATEDALDDLPLNRIFKSLQTTPKRSKERSPERAKGIKEGSSFSCSKITPKKLSGTKKRKYIESFKITPKRSDGMKKEEKSPETSKWKDKDTDASVALRSPLKKAKKLEDTLTEETKVSNVSASTGLPSIVVKTESNYPSIPPGFPPKSKLIEGRDATKEDNQTIEILLKCSKKQCDENLSCQSFSSASIADSETVERQTELDGTIMGTEPVDGVSERAMEDATDSKTGSPPGHDVMEVRDGEGDDDEDVIQALLRKVESIRDELIARMTEDGHPIH